MEPPPTLGAAGGVVDERAPVPRPVRRLEGLRGAVDHLPVPGLHVEDLEAAPDVVPVGNEALAGRADEAHVVEDGALHHVGVVRAQEQPHVHVVAQGEALDLAGREQLAEPGRREGEGASLPLELDDVGPLDLGAGLLRRCPLRAPELERDQAVAVHRGVGVRRVGVEARACDDARLAVRVDALAQEPHPRLEDEVALEPLPDEVELVPRAPHVDAGGGEPVLLRDRVVRGRARQPGRPDVGARLEVPDRGALRADESGRPGDRAGEKAGGQHASDAEPEERRVGVHRASSRPNGR